MPKYGGLCIFCKISLSLNYNFDISVMLNGRMDASLQGGPQLPRQNFWWTGAVGGLENNTVYLKKTVCP